MAQRLKRAGAFPVPEALGVVQAVAAGLDYAHGLGILHRDLKPENVMLGADGRVKILDFGVALETAAARMPDPVASGTPAYMSPEQLFGEPIGVTSDVYSLGVVVFEMLTERLPHASEHA